MDAPADEGVEALEPQADVVLCHNAISIFVDHTRISTYLNKYLNKGA